MVTLAAVIARSNGSYRVRLRSIKKGGYIANVHVNKETLFDQTKFQEAVKQQTGKSFRREEDKQSWTGLIHFLTKQERS